MARYEKKSQKNFLLMGRRELIEISLFGVAWIYLGHVQDFTTDRTDENESQSKQIDLSGNFVWHDQYNAEFIQKYYNLAKYLRNILNIKFLDNIINHPFPIEKYRLTKEKTLSLKILQTDDYSGTEPVTVDDILAHY